MKERILLNRKKPVPNPLVQKKLMIAHELLMKMLREKNREDETLIEWFILGFRQRDNQYHLIIHLSKDITAYQYFINYMEMVTKLEVYLNINVEVRGLWSRNDIWGYSCYVNGDVRGLQKKGQIIFPGNPFQKHRQGRKKIYHHGAMEN